MTDLYDREHLPVLRAAVDGCNNDLTGIRAHDIAQQLNLPYERVELALRALAGDGLIDVAFMTGTAARVRAVTGEAQRRAGTWPTAETGLERMIAALEELAEHADTEDDRTRARKALDALAGASREVLLGVTTAVITGQLPGQ